MPGPSIEFKHAKGGRVRYFEPVRFSIQQVPAGAQKSRKTSHLINIPNRKTAAGHRQAKDPKEQSPSADRPKRQANRRIQKRNTNLIRSNRGPPRQNGRLQIRHPEIRKRQKQTRIRTARRER